MEKWKLKRSLRTVPVSQDYCFHPSRRILQSPSEPLFYDCSIVRGYAQPLAALFSFRLLPSVIELTRFIAFYLPFLLLINFLTVTSSRTYASHTRSLFFNKHQDFFDSIHDRGAPIDPRSDRAYNFPEHKGQKRANYFHGAFEGTWMQIPKTRCSRANHVSAIHDDPPELFPLA